MSDIPTDMRGYMEHEWLTVAQAAKLLGLSERQVRTHARAGRLPGQLVGRVWIFRREDVQRFKPRPRGRPRQ